MEAALKTVARQRQAQIQYLADDPEMCDLLWQIAALPDDARIVIRMMVAYLGDQSRRVGG
jgi:ApbE superfamily uncharacterized protein (UPF0280 family)